MRATDFIGQGRYLRQEDVPSPYIVTIDSYQRVELEQDDETRVKCAIQFREIKKPLLANSTNMSIMMQLFGDDMRSWVGRQVVVYVDPTVMFAGKPVGGLRVKAPPSYEASAAPAAPPIQHHDVPAGTAVPPFQNPPAGTAVEPFNPEAHDNDWRGQPHHPDALAGPNPTSPDGHTPF